jgi:serine/threonine protein kinase
VEHVLRTGYTTNFPHDCQQICIMMYQIVSAVSHLHRHRVVHCDLKPDNFVSMDKFDVATLKV